MAKYSNRKVVNALGSFDSQKEFTRYLELQQLEREGKIRDLVRQVQFQLAPACVIQGRRRPPMRYRADFVYMRHGRPTVEDVKGFRTRTYLIKRHLMMTEHGIEILET